MMSHCGIVRQSIYECIRWPWHPWQLARLSPIYKFCSNMWEGAHWFWDDSCNYSSSFIMMKLIIGLWPSHLATWICLEVSLPLCNIFEFSDAHTKRVATSNIYALDDVCIQVYVQFDIQNRMARPNILTCVKPFSCCLCKNQMIIPLLFSRNLIALNGSTSGACTEIKRYLAHAQSKVF